MNKFISNTGYRNDSPDQNNPYNIIPSNRISMKNVSKNLVLYPVNEQGEKGNAVLARKGQEFYFPNHSHVIEVPINKDTMKKLKKYGGPTGNGNLKKSDQHLLYGTFQTGGGIDPTEKQNIAIPSTTGINTMGINQTNASSVPYARSYTGPNNQPVYVKYTLPIGTKVNPQNPDFLQNPSTFANAGVQSMTPEEYAAFSTKYPSQVTQFKSDVKPSFELGGQNNFKTSDLLENNKNDFLKYLKKTSMEALTSEMTKHASFHHMPDGTIMSDAQMEEGGYMKKGGNWIQGAVNPAHKGYCTPMTKATCTPARKRFAMTMKKHHGFHKQDGGDNSILSYKLPYSMPTSVDTSGLYKNPYYPEVFNGESVSNEKQADQVVQSLKYQEYLSTQNKLHPKPTGKYIEPLATFQDGGPSYQMNDQGDYPEGTYNDMVDDQVNNDDSTSNITPDNSSIFQGRANELGYDKAMDEYNYWMNGQKPMAYGGQKKNKSTLSSYCNGSVDAACITKALNSSDPDIRKKAAFIQSMRKVRMQPGGSFTGYDPNADQGTSYFSNVDGNQVSADQMYGSNNGLNNQNPSIMGQTVGMQPPLTQPTLPQAKQLPSSNPFDNESLLNFGMIGMDAITGLANGISTRKRQQKLRSKTHADQVFMPLTGNGANNRGDYSINEGYFQPNNMVPTQFQGNSGQWKKYGGSFQEGGEYYLNDADIQQILDAGGELDFIDE